MRGPTVLTAPFLIEELFTLFGKRMADYIELVEPDPWYRFHFHDGETFDYGPTEAATEAEIARLSPRDVEGYRRMGAWSKKIYDIGFTRLSTVPFHSVGFMLKQIPHLLRLRSYESVWGMVAGSSRMIACAVRFRSSRFWWGATRSIPRRSTA